MSGGDRPRREAKTGGHKPAWWAPRFWLGHEFFAWVRLLAANRFAVGWRQWHIAVTDTVVSIFNTLLGQVQSVIYGRRVAGVQIDPAPLFILGHWRTGTTWLHELLILDPRHTFATTYECLAPNHFLLTEGILGRVFRFLVPPKRPMDNMALGLERPQEDEFALCNLGLPSPYLKIAFPNHPAPFPESLEIEGLSPDWRRRWKQGFFDFLKKIYYRRPGRIVLKSPPHTCRIKVLLDLFPDARFVHIVRDPYVVFASTVHLWKSLYATHGLQTPTFEGLEDDVFDTFVRMYDKLAQTRGLVPPNRFCEVRYEELVRDPVGQLRFIYEQLELGDFDAARPAVEQYLAGIKDYQTNEYELSSEDYERITQRWGDVISRYGYEREAARV